MTLTDFLLARIAEDEAVARQAEADSAAAGGDPSILGEYYDPARVLAECEAKRRIVEMHHSTPAPGVDRDGFDLGGYWCNECDDGISWPCPTLRALAAVYAGHPDYRDEWRP